MMMLAAGVLLATAGWLLFPGCGIERLSESESRDFARTWVRVKSRWHGRVDIGQESGRVAEAYTLLAAELRAGIEPAQAAAHVAQDHPQLAPWAATLAAGGDVRPTLERIAQRPGWSRVVDLEAVWQVSAATGAPLADVISRVAADVRDDLDLVREIDRQVAPAKSTARLLAMLPILGLLLGSGMGKGPIATVTSSPIATVSIAVGLTLAGVGWWWITRIIASARTA
jgi:tight adherence protein B